jgi:vacuolar-type H+-ATPase subunit I/STV1
MKTKIIFLLLITSCVSTPNLNIDKPKDYSQVIKTLEKSNIETSLKAKVVNTIKEQEDYSNKCYKKIIELEERLNELEEVNKKLNQENIELRRELATWLAIKTFFWIAIVVILLIVAFRFLYPIIRPIMTGLPI